MPTRTIKTKYYVFRQDNPRGYFIDDEQIGLYVIIEAMNADQANGYAYRKCNMGMGMNHSHWDYADESDSSETPVIAHAPAEEYAYEFLPHMGAKSIHIYHFNGKHTIYRRTEKGAELEIINGKF